MSKVSQRPAHKGCTDDSIVTAVLRAAGIETRTSEDVAKAEGALLEAHRSLKAFKGCGQSIVMSVFRDEANDPVDVSVLVSIASRQLASRTPSDMGYSADGPPITKIQQTRTRAQKRGSLEPKLGA
jgi:hypothetical protein